jgi:hypothetical protein
MFVISTGTTPGIDALFLLEISLPNVRVCVLALVLICMRKGTNTCAEEQPITVTTENYAICR